MFPYCEIDQRSVGRQAPHAVMQWNHVTGARQSALNLLVLTTAVAGESSSASPIESDGCRISLRTK